MAAPGNFRDSLERFVGESRGPFLSWDPVNQPMIRHAAEALGDTNPVYTDPQYAAASIHSGIVAPPALLQVWTMKGYSNAHPPGSDPRAGFELFDLLVERGYTGVVAVNCEQEYERYLRPGDRVSYRVEITDISDEKSTGLGVGFFVTQRYTFEAGEGEQVGKMLFRTLRYKSAAQAQEN